MRSVPVDGAIIVRELDLLMGERDVLRPVVEAALAEYDLAVAAALGEAQPFEVEDAVRRCDEAIRAYRAAALPGLPR